MNTKTITIAKGMTVIVVQGIPRDQEKCVRKMFFMTLEKLEKMLAVPAARIRAEIKKEVPLAGTPAGALKAYRLRVGITQARLAELSGLKQSHISEMEKGKRAIGLKSAKALAKALRCRWDRLAGPRDDRP